MVHHYARIGANVLVVARRESVLKKVNRKTNGIPLCQDGF